MAFLCNIWQMTASLSVLFDEIQTMLSAPREFPSSLLQAVKNFRFITSVLAVSLFQVWLT